MRGLKINGDLFFNLGIFFLPSAFPIGGIFLLFGLVTSLIKNRSKLFVQKIDFLVLIFGILLTISNLKSFLFADQVADYKVQNSLIDIANWIPQILCFLAFNFYLNDEKKRKTFVNFLLLGSVPVIFSFITQKWFNVYGPHKTFFDLIIWFQKEPTKNNFTGLFSNANYAGFWLSLIFPFSLQAILKNKKNLLLGIFCFLITYFNFMTGSRNAFLSLIASTTLLIGISSIIISGITVILFYLLISKNNASIEFNSNFIPLQLFSKFSDFNFENFTRFEIYKKTIELISIKPIWGWGPMSFPIIYEFFDGKYQVQHTHNIFLEISFNYGLITTLLFSIIICIITYNSFSVILFQEKFNTILNKAFLASFLAIIIFHLSDFPYYDGKVSLISWIILSALNSIIRESQNQEQLNAI